MKLFDEPNKIAKNQSYDLFIIKFILQLAAFFASLRALMFFLNKEYFYTFCIVVFLFSIIIALRLVIKSKILKAKFVIVFSYSLMSFILYYFRGLDMLPWIILTPVAAIVLLGTNLGLISSVLYFMVVVIITYFRVDFLISHINVVLLIIESVTVYACALVFGILYERIRKVHIDRLKYYSNYDALTGISNRRFFYQYGAKELEKSNRFKQDLSVMMLDLDDFKKLNDKYGHAKGDMILMKFCNLVKKFVRKSDIFARIGGEEFVIMLYNVNKESALMLADKIVKTVASTDFDMPERLTVSIGVTSKNEGDDLDSLLNRADKALYKAKHKGKNRCEFL